MSFSEESDDGELESELDDEFESDSDDEESDIVEVSDDPLGDGTEKSRLLNSISEGVINSLVDEDAEEELDEDDGFDAELDSDDRVGADDVVAEEAIGRACMLPVVGFSSNSVSTWSTSMLKTALTWGSCSRTAFESLLQTLSESL